MSDDAFLGEIRPFANNFAPYGWLQCQGQILPISQYAALFSLLGTSYGGNGTSNFALPNIQGQVLIGTGSGAGLSTFVIGEEVGAPTVSINSTTMPAHNHPFNIGTDDTTTEKAADGNVPVANVSLLTNLFGRTSAGGSQPGSLVATASTPANTVQMATTMIGATGGGQPHENHAPYVVINYCIAMQGQFPTRS